MSRRVGLAGAVALLGLVSGCVENTAPGNDREAELAPPEPPARVAGPEEALSNVATAVLKPQIMTDADLGSLPELGPACRFRMTRVAFPSLVYGSSAVVKLNGTLVTLPRAGESRFAAGGVEVSVRPLESGDDGGGLVETEFVLRLPGAAHELGFHGFAECDA